MRKSFFLSAAAVFAAPPGMGQAAAGLNGRRQPAGMTNMPNPDAPAQVAPAAGIFRGRTKPRPQRPAAPDNASAAACSGNKPRAG